MTVRVRVNEYWTTENKNITSHSAEEHTEVKCTTILTLQIQKGNKWILSVLRLLYCLGNDKRTSLLISRVTIKRTVKYYTRPSKIEKNDKKNPKVFGN